MLLTIFMIFSIQCTRYMECKVVKSKVEMQVGNHHYITRNGEVKDEEHYLCKSINVKECAVKEDKFMTGSEHLLNNNNSEEFEHDGVCIESNLDNSQNRTNQHVFNENNQLAVTKTLSTSNLSHLTKSIELSYEYGNDNTKKDKDMFNLILFKNVNYLLFGLNQICANFGLSIIYVHLAAYTRNIAKVSDDASAILFIIIGGVGFVSRNIWGFIGQIPRVATTAIYAIGIPFF